jgi:hypothetical protein
MVVRAQRLTAKGNDEEEMFSVCFQGQKESYGYETLYGMQHI